MPGGTEEIYGNLRMIGVPNENRTAEFLTTKQNRTEVKNACRYNPTRIL